MFYLSQEAVVIVYKKMNETRKISIKMIKRKIKRRIDENNKKKRSKRSEKLQNNL